ncbi:hypothetical protein OGATHE_005116 [Ogataea polymorpha]|uniref:Uncharacterized protein n=1 Tax=Ogataea polymorpha TaxID=460523 RepID=A0A9P8T042_9ASCO|nr:hypothetical protein OGATHE_005116 [Ogataea polymorpha]
MALRTSSLDFGCSEEHHVLARLEQVSVDLRLDVDSVNSVSFQPSDVNFHIEMANVTNDGVLWHNREVLTSDDVSATSGSHKYLTNWGSFLHSGDLVTRNSGLQSINWVNLSNDHSSAHTSQSHGTTLTNVTKTGNNSNLTGDHNVGGSFDTVNQRFSATVQVVKLRFGNGIIDIDGWNLQGTLLHHLVQVMNTGGRLLRKTVTTFQHFWVFLVDKRSQVSTVIQDQVELFSVLESKQLLLNTP